MGKFGLMGVFLLDAILRNFLMSVNYLVEGLRAQFVEVYIHSSIITGTSCPASTCRREHYSFSHNLYSLWWDFLINFHRTNPSWYDSLAYYMGPMLMTAKFNKKRQLFFTSYVWCLAMVSLDFSNFRKNSKNNKKNNKSRRESAFTTYDN